MRPRLGQAVWCLVTALLLIGVAVGCAESRGSIAGIVYDEDGAPAGELLVRAVRPEYPGVLLRTEDDGSYRVNSVPTGEWNLEFYDQHGWQVGLELVTVEPNETVTLDFTIGAKPLPDGLIPSKIENAPQSR